jgi:HAD superfamily hydrolase (TIGR01549 family)
MCYQAIGFDYVGVIYGEPGAVFGKKVADFLNVSPDELKSVYFQHNHKSNLLGISFDDLWRAVAFDLGRADQAENLVQFIAKENHQKKINQDIVELMKMLRSRGYKIGVLSNYNFTLRAKLESQGVASFVDAIGCSEEMGYMKPQKEIFQMFCEMLAIKPEELIYIDDSEKSLSTSAEVDYTPLLFENYKKLKYDLEKLGVL